MKTPTVFTLALLASFCTAPAALAHEHNHLTIDTATGSPGDQISILAGFLPDESDFSISPEGTVLHMGVAHEYHADEYLPAPLDNWLAGDGAVLTSDFFFSTGRLDGGNFAYEISSVVPVTRGAAGAVVAWGLNGLEAFSDGATRVDRSFTVGAGGHPHGQFYAVNQPGEFLVTLVAWDLNGVYADSAPVTFTLHAAPPPCQGDLNADGAVNTSDLVLMLARFGQSVASGEPADINQDGAVNTVDLTLLLARFGLPC